ncbi:MAG: multiprotein bridging factor aMBF1 [Candidatus Methanomethylophilaceae archaeon]|nr:putative transcription factor [Candidatus Methanomethylophilaceae archaeon]
MPCEMCGKSVPFTKSVMIDGAKLEVCPECARFGDDYKASMSSQSSGRSTGSTGGSRTVIEQRLERREKRMGTKDVYAQAKTVEVVENYGKVVREAREAKGMDLDAFSKFISEKKGTIAKVEANRLVPDDKLVKKIEKALDVKLLETVLSGAGQSTGGNSSGKMTLGDFIKKK